MIVSMARESSADLFFSFLRLLLARYGALLLRGAFGCEAGFIVLVVVICGVFE